MYFYITSQSFIWIVHVFRIGLQLFYVRFLSVYIEVTHNANLLGSVLFCQPFCIDLHVYGSSSWYLGARDALVRGVVCGLPLWACILNGGALARARFGQEL